MRLVLLFIDLVFSRSREVATARKHEIDKGEFSLIGSGYAGLDAANAKVVEKEARLTLSN